MNFLFCATCVDYYPLPTDDVLVDHEGHIGIVVGDPGERSVASLFAGWLHARALHTELFGDDN